MPRPKKRKRMTQVCFRIPVETLIALQIEAELANLDGNEYNLSMVIRKTLNEHVSSEEFLLKVKHFKTEHPKRYGSILRKFA